jgi:hypothetical protein
MKKAPLSETTTARTTTASKEGAWAAIDAEKGKNERRRRRG